MGTNFYLADEMYMTTEQIERAKSLVDGASFVCHKSHTKDGDVFSLGIDPVYLFSFPANIRLINDNSSGIKTIGELVQAIESEGSKLRLPNEVAEQDYEHIENWLRSHRGHEEWDRFINFIDVESLFKPRKNANSFFSARSN